MGSSLFRPLRLLTLGFVATLAFALLANGILAWHSARRLDQIHGYVQRLIDLQEIGLRIERVARDSLSGTIEDLDRQREVLSGELEQIQQLEDPIAVGTPVRLARVEALLAARPFTPEAMVSALQELGEIAKRETEAQQRLLESARVATRSEQRLTLLVPLVLLALAVGVVLIGRRRIVMPLRDLESVVQRLAEGHFDPVADDGVDPLLEPLFDNYNHLVRRLGELEDEHRSRAASLEAEVRNATHALLEQQRSLARAERLAAAGMMAASLAHELRNPLAGIDLALRNLRGEIGDADARERIDLVAEELRRMQGLLNGLLDSARTAPERSHPQELGATVRSLLSLVRYQVPDGVTLVPDIPGELWCDLPENRLRQALLNLVLNSAQALDGNAGEVIVSARQDGQLLRIQVSDDGPGFGPELLQRGVRPFLSSRKGGTGLGLPMVKRFVDDLGGALEISNLDRGGACVTMTLPCRASHA